MLGRARAAFRRRRREISRQIEFYDEPTSWGLIRGDDGHLYDLRGGQLAGSPPRVGDKVLFEPQSAPGGPPAVAVRRVKSPRPRQLLRGRLSCDQADTRRGAPRGHE
jgi:hypothetical protein